MLSIFTRYKHVNDRFTEPAAEFKLPQLYNDQTFYKAFVWDLMHAEREVIIESPFLSRKRTNELVPIFEALYKRGVQVRINTRSPFYQNTDEYRIQALTSIKKLRAAGVKVKWYDDMRHRKIAIVDEKILWEGSLNIMSQSHSIESMTRTQSAARCQQVIQFTGLKRWTQRSVL